MEKATSYLQHAAELLREIEATQDAAIDAVSTEIADCLRRGGLWHVFGTGHSHMAAEELYYRAGGLAPVNAILHPPLMQHEGPVTSTKLERSPGLARQILRSQELRPGEVFMVVSNSGKNAVPVEAALYANELGLTTVALTSLRQSRAATLPDGVPARLFEVCHLVIDNLGAEGDAVLDPRSRQSPELRVAGTSSVANLAILEEIVYRVCCHYTAAGEEPPVFKSANLPGGDAWNQSLIDTYGSRINLR